MDIRELEPKKLWQFFYELTQIPRPSKKERKAVEYVRKFAEDRGLEVIVDEVGNVIVRKPATPGMENKKGIILQAHLDMVPQKNSDIEHDFEKDPIQAYVDGEWVTARGTTLGADDGIGVAAALAVLDSNDIKHGPIEALFTIDEETGMTGAFNLKPGLLKGDILINVDSEDEGELYIGCAGGIDATMIFNYKEVVPANGNVAYKVEIKGLKGGHSGIDINLGRGNANIVLARFIYSLSKEMNVGLSEFYAGNMRNAIPREGYAVITVDNSSLFEEKVKEFELILKNEYGKVEPELEFFATKSGLPDKIMAADDKKRIINAIVATPNGVIRMSNDMPDLVETSTNLAIVNIKNGKAEIMALMRSSVDSAKKALADVFEALYTLAGADKIEFAGEYPGWKPNPDSPILRIMKEQYKSLFGKIPEVKAIHAGLECGLLGGIYPNWDMISIGPTIRYPHSPDEKVNIPSVKKFWDFLVHTLENVEDKN